MVFSPKLICIVAVAAMATAAPWALSEPGVNPLSTAVTAAWHRSVQGRTLEARRDEVTAGREAAQLWTAGAPSIGLAERSDRWTNQAGRRETEISLAAPIWLPGQKSARQALAHAGADDLEAQITHAKLTIAGEVRERLWAVAAAREALAEAENRQKHLEKFSEEVAQRVKAGDLARSDGMLAQQEVLAARAAVGAARARANEALSRYTVLTGQPDIPPSVPEPIADAGPNPHPRLVAARAAVQRTRASLSVVNATRSTPPTVGVSMRHEQDGSSAGSRSIGLSVQIPIGTAARNRPLETATLTQIETATVELAQAEATLQSDISLAEQQLTISQQALESTASRTALTREHLQLIEKAFRQGERGLADLLRAEFLAHEAEAAERQQRAAVGLAHARLNQARGILP